MTWLTLSRTCHTFANREDTKLIYSGQDLVTMPVCSIVSLEVPETWLSLSNVLKMTWNNPNPQH